MGEEGKQFCYRAMNETRALDLENLRERLKYGVTYLFPWSE